MTGFKIMGIRGSRYAVLISLKNKRCPVIDRNAALPWVSHEHLIEVDCAQHSIGLHLKIATEGLSGSKNSLGHFQPIAVLQGVRTKSDNYCCGLTAWASKVKFMPTWS